MRTIEIKRWAPFLHKDLTAGDVLNVLWERSDNYGNILYICESRCGNQYLKEYELNIISNPREVVTVEKASEKQIAGNHYKKLKIQPMQYNLANNMNYAQANAIKYITRYKDKNGIEDLKKAIHCLELLIEFETQSVEDEQGES